MSDKPAEEAPKEEAKDEAAKETAAKEAAAKEAAGKEAAGKEAAAKEAAAKEAAAKEAAAKEAAAKEAAAQEAKAAEDAEKAARDAKAKAAAKPAGPAGPARGKLLLVAWGPSPAATWEAQLAHAGFEVYTERSARLGAFQWANDNQPVAAVIDLSQNPDDGKRLATTLRITGATAGIPLVFCDAVGGGAAALASVDAVLSALSKL